MQTRADGLQELGRIHGMKGKELSGSLLSGLSGLEIQAYLSGVRAGEDRVKDSPTVDAGHLRVA